MIIKVKDVKKILEQGKRIEVKTLNGEYTNITNYIEKGTLDTFLVSTQNYFIKVSNDHLFFSRAKGWIKTRHLNIGQFILCNDQIYQKVINIEYIGKEKIVDITVDHPEHCYYGNGILNHNSGKSWVLCNLAAHAIKLGKKVVYYTLEMTEEEIGCRIDSMLAKKPTQYIEMKANWDKVKKLIQPYRNNLRIKQFLPDMTKVEDIQNHMNQLVLFEEFNPDLIVIDYADILKKQTNINNLYTAYSNSYTNLKRLAKQYRKPIWTASQGNRCLALDTIVQLKDKSQIKIQDVKVGDQLVSINGANKVVSIYHDKQPIYQIKLKNGKTIKCSANHMFPSNNGSLKSIESGLTVNNILYYKNNKKISEIQIQNIQLQDIQETIDIEVQGNHLFFANDILTHNSSINSQFVLGDDIAHSLGKLEIADFVLSMSRKQEDKMSNTARFVVVKNRGGRDGNVYNAIVDFDIGSIQIFDNYTKNSIEARQKMDNNDALLKQSVRERLQIIRKQKQQQEKQK